MLKLKCLLDSFRNVRHPVCWNVLSFRAKPDVYPSDSEQCCNMNHQLSAVASSSDQKNELVDTLRD